MAALARRALLVLLLALGFFVDRSRGGATLVYVGFAVLVLGTLARRGAPFWLELAAFSGLVTRPIGLWAHGFLVAVLLASVASAEGDARASWLEEGLVALFAALGVAGAALVNRWGLVPLGLLALEAWGPRAPRTAGAATKRTASFAIAASAAVMLGSDWRPGARADELVFAVAVFLGAFAAFEVAGRTLSRDGATRLEELIERLMTAGEGRARPLAFLAALALLGAVLLGTGTIRWRESVSVAPAAIVADDGYAFLAPSVDAAPDGVRLESTLEVLEDGRPLAPAHTLTDEVRRLGHGRFLHATRNVLFSSSDGTDPRTGAHRYTLRYERAAGPFVLWTLVATALLLNARLAGRALDALGRAHPALLGASVLAIAALYRVQIALQEPALTFGGHLVKGAPFSDARDWLEAAIAFSRGDWKAEIWQLCGARRPGHYALLGALFALTGPSLVVARALNVAASLAVPVLVFDGMRRLTSRAVALLAALVPALLLYDACSDFSVMTEPLGDFFAALSFWAFAVAATRDDRGLAFFGSGLALGISNLARPLTLGAAAGMPLGLAAFAPRRRALVGGAALALGVAVTVGPWLVRQRAVHGITTISENTAEAWFAATDPRWGSWSSEVAPLGTGSLAERATFYAEGTKRNLREHTGWYVRHVIDQLGVAFRITQAPAWVVIAACAWHLVAARRRGARRAVLAPLLGIALALVPSAPLYGLTLVAVIAAWRRPVLVVAGFFLATLGSVALLGMAYDRRLMHSLEWPAAALSAWVVLETLARLEGVSADEPDTRPWGRWRALPIALAVLALALALGGFARVLTTQPPPRDERPLSADAISRTLEEPAFATFAERLVVRRARLLKGSEMHFAAGERVDHWATLFEPRPYGFTVFATDPGLPERYLVFPGELPAGDELVVVGVPVVYPGIATTLEVLAVSANGAWTRPGAAVAREHARVIASKLAKAQ